MIRHETKFHIASLLNAAKNLPLSSLVRELVNAGKDELIEFAEGHREGLIRTYEFRFNHARTKNLPVVGEDHVLEALKRENSESVWGAEVSDDKFHYTIIVDNEMSRVICCFGVANRG